METFSQASTVLIPKNIEEVMPENIIQTFEMKKCTGEGKYLGLPYLIRRLKKNLLIY